MVEWYWIVGGTALTIFILLLFEDSRDWISEAFSYVIQFDWWQDFVDFLGSAFEGLNEFSWYGLTFGFLTTATVFFLSKWTLAPFLVYYDATGKVVWTIITYLGTGVAGYFMGKAFENSS